MRILGIETSCDETAAAVVENGRQVIAEAVYSQIPQHAFYGGVVPEVAARAHAAKLPVIVPQVLEEAGGSIDAVAVTYGPGLVGALVTGIAFAKGLAYALQRPLIGVDHIAGHIASLYLSHRSLRPPFVCLVASGGHTEIVQVLSHDTMQILGTTRDDAAGEAIDKVARRLGLPYPGGPHLEELAEHGHADAYDVPQSFRGQDHLDFSFSGPKTAVVHLLENIGDTEAVRADVAASFLESVVEVLTANTAKACRETGVHKVCLAGGVSANHQLRKAMQQMADREGLQLFLPDPKYCGDNGAMIASAAYFAPAGPTGRPLFLNADPGADLDEYRHQD